MLTRRTKTLPTALPILFPPSSGCTAAPPMHASKRRGWREENSRPRSLPIWAWREHAPSRGMGRSTQTRRCASPTLRMAQATRSWSEKRPPSQDLWYGWWYAGHGVNGTGMGDMVLGVREMGPPSDAYVPDCGGPAHFVPGRVENMCDAFHFWSLHSGGANYLFADGSVRFLPYAADPFLPALATRSGGEVADLPF